MYRAIESFSTKNYDVRRMQLLDEEESSLGELGCKLSEELVELESKFELSSDHFAINFKFDSIM